MCIGCYEEGGKPKVINNNVKTIAAKIQELYKHNPVGGNCHIVTDDWNLEDHHIDYCIKEGVPGNTHEHPEDIIKLELEILNGLKNMTMDERLTSLAIKSGYITDSNQELS